MANHTGTSTMLKTILRRVVGWLGGRSQRGVPAGHALYTRRVSWLYDLHDNQLCVRADCGFCAYQAHFPFAISKIDRHLRSEHPKR